ncbi:MAG: tetratricopeptide repeat protein [Alphaproteobacteria bacterium]
MRLNPILIRLAWLTGFLLVSASQGFADQGKELFDHGRYPEAIVWWKNASETQKDHQAEFRLGDYYESGLAEPENLPEAAKWYALAAEGGHSGAQFALGSFYEAGAGVEPSAEKAAFWYGKCAARNIANCQFNLGRLSSSGEAGAQDLVEAYKWYYLSAKNGFLEFDSAEMVALAARLTSDQKREAVKQAVAFKPEP